MVDYAALYRQMEEERKTKPEKQSSGWNPFEWSDEKINLAKGQIDKLAEDIQMVEKYNEGLSIEHVANVILRRFERCICSRKTKRFNFTIPDEIWEYLVEKCRVTRDQRLAHDAMLVVEAESMEE